MIKKDYKEELFSLLNEGQIKDFQKDTHCLLPYAANLVALAITLYIKYGLFTYFENDGLSYLITCAYEDWIDSLDKERKLKTGVINLTFSPLEKLD